MIDRKIRNYLDRARKSINCIKHKNSKIWWKLILWTTLLPSKWPRVFSQKLIWSGEIYYTNIVVLDLFWRWEVKKISFLRNDAFHCVFIRLHGNTFSNLKNAQLVSQAIKADHEAAEHFVCHRGPSTNHRRNERFWKSVIFVCWLAPKHKPHDMIPGISRLRILLQCCCINFQQLRHGFLVPWICLLSFVVP